MSRIISSVLVFLILMNGTVTMMTASGLNEDLGVTLAPGIDDSMDNLIESMKDAFDPDAGLGQTLFSLFISAVTVGEIMIKGLAAAPQAFLSMGFPSWIIFPLFAPMYMLSTLYLVYLATGRQSV